MNELEKYLNQISNQELTEESKILVVQNPVADLICEKYLAWLFGEHVSYKDALPLIKDLSYTSKDIKDFSIELKKYENLEWFMISGLFLSALINKSSEEKFEILTAHLNKTIHWFGIFNEKNITVIGNIGNCTGYDMKEKGEIHVQGKIEQIYATCKGKVFQNGQQVNWPQWSN